MRRREDDDTRRMRLHLERQRTISSTTLRADWSISSWTNERQRRARACCSGSSRTISSPYRYTPMALNTHTHIIKYFISLKSRGCSLSVKVCSTRCSSVVCIYLVMNQKVFHISVSPGVRVFDHQLTPTMSDLEAKTQDHIHY